MDALTDHYADLIIQAQAPTISCEVRPDAFARAVWVYARAVSAERARLIAEDIEELRKSHKIPAPASADAPSGETPSRHAGPPTAAAAVGAGEVVDEELAPFLEATKDLRGHPVEAGKTCEGGDLLPNDCVDPAVERVAHVRLCFRHAREEFAAIAIDPTEGGGVDGARAEAFNVPHDPSDSAAVQQPHGPENATSGEQSAPSGAREADGGYPPPGDQGGRELVALDSIRGPATPKEASRGGIAPAAPEVGAQPPAEVAGHADAAEAVAQEEAPSVQPVQEVHHEVPLVDAKGSDSGEVAGTAAVPAPRYDSVCPSCEAGQHKKCQADESVGLICVCQCPPPTGKRGRPTKRESVPHKAKALTCGGTNCSDDSKTIKHHVGDPTCSQYGPRDPVTPKVVGKQRAGELAAKYEGSAT